MPLASTAPRLVHAAVLLVLLIFFSINSNAAVAAPTTVRDVFGREVVLPGPAKRIVVLNRDMAETIRALGAAELIVGVGDTLAKDPLFWGELAKRTLVGRWNNPDYETIARLAPDLVLAHERLPGPEAETRLAALGIPLLRLELFRSDRFERDLGALAAALDRRAEAARLGAWWRSALGRVAECVAGRPAMSVYTEHYDAFHALGPGSAGFALAELGGGAPVSAELGGAYRVVDPEWVLARAPEAVVKSMMSVTDAYSRGDSPRLSAAATELAGRPGFASLPTVHSGRVLILGSEIASGPKAPVGLYHIARMLHPESCGRLDPDRLLADYL